MKNESLRQKKIARRAKRNKDKKHNYDIKMKCKYAALNAKRAALKAEEAKAKRQIFADAAEKWLRDSNKSELKEQEVLK